MIRNRKGAAKFAKLTYNARIKASAKEAGIKVRWDAPDVLSKLAYLTQVPKEFDFEKPLSSPGSYHIGPFCDASLEPATDFP